MSSQDSTWILEAILSRVTSGRSDPDGACHQSDISGSPPAEPRVSARLSRPAPRHIFPQSITAQNAEFLPGIRQMRVKMQNRVDIGNINGLEYFYLYREKAP